LFARHVFFETADKTPTFNIQTPEKHQHPTINSRDWSLVLLWSLDVGIWSFVVSSCLGFSFPHSPVILRLCRLTSNL
jgi:hypothetical protein